MVVAVCSGVGAIDKDKRGDQPVRFGPECFIMLDTCPDWGSRWRFPQIRTLRSQVCKPLAFTPPAPAVCQWLIGSVVSPIHLRQGQCAGIVDMGTVRDTCI